MRYTDWLITNNFLLFPIKVSVPSAGNPGQRRDPIGYFSDNTHGGSMVPNATRPLINNGYENYQPAERTIARYDAPMYGDTAHFSNANSYNSNYSMANNNNNNNNNAAANYEPSWNNDRYEEPVSGGQYDHYDQARSGPYGDQDPNDMLDQAMNQNHY